jgi:glycine cleavage system aminomethyltransferase T
MTKDYLVEAIFKLRPNAEFVILDNDYAKIEWHQLEGNAPTQAEIDSAIEQIKADDFAAKAKAEADKAAAQAKLEKLGLTADDLKALGL